MAAIEFSGSEEHGSPFGCKGPSPPSNETMNTNYDNKRETSPTAHANTLINDSDREESQTTLRFTEQTTPSATSPFGLGLRL